MINIILCLNILKFSTTCYIYQYSIFVRIRIYTLKSTLVTGFHENLHIHIPFGKMHKLVELNFQHLGTARYL